MLHLAHGRITSIEYGYNLSPRQKLICRLLADGIRQYEIADQIGVTRCRVKQLVVILCRKFGVRSTIALAVTLSAPLDSPFRRLMESTPLPQAVEHVEGQVTPAPRKLRHKKRRG